MVNEDIITSLKNAIEQGESIDTAIAIAITSGYNQREVEEAAKFVGRGVISAYKVSPEELLTMPSQKSFFSKKIEQPLKPVQIQPKPRDEQIQSRPKETPEYYQRATIQQPAQKVQPVQRPQTQMVMQTQPRNISLKKHSYLKEIILLILLLILVGILILTVKYKEQIISFFS
jgi:FtsZ-interacting cell division protein ZipA